MSQSNEWKCHEIAIKIAQISLPFNRETSQQQLARDSLPFLRHFDILHPRRLDFYARFFFSISLSGQAGGVARHWKCYLFFPLSFEPGERIIIFNFIPYLRLSGMFRDTFFASFLCVPLEWEWRIFQLTEGKKNFSSRRNSLDSPFNQCCNLLSLTVIKWDEFRVCCVLLQRKQKISLKSSRVVLLCCESSGFFQFFPLLTESLCVCTQKGEKSEQKIFHSSDSTLNLIASSCCCSLQSSLFNFKSLPNVHGS